MVDCVGERRAMHNFQRTFRVGYREIFLMLLRRHPSPGRVQCGGRRDSRVRVIGADSSYQTKWLTSQSRQESRSMKCVSIVSADPAGPEWVGAGSISVL